MYLPLVTKIRGNKTEWDYVIKSKDISSSPSENFHIMLVVCVHIPNCSLQI